MILTDEQVEDIRDRLVSIRDKMGAFNRDTLIHAVNVIDSNSKHATIILNIMEEAEKK